MQASHQESNPISDLPKRRSRLRKWFARSLPFLFGALGAVIVLFLSTVLRRAPEPLTLNEVQDSIAQAMASATPPAAYSAQVYQLIRPSLVYIQTEFAADGESDNHGLGSGVLISDRGDILTSLHVVADATDILVSFADGTRTGAQILAADPAQDIAVLRVESLPQLLVPAVLGNPNAMRVGDEAFVVGNPLGLSGSMSAGVISGFNRSFQLQDSDQSLEGLIQFDAAVNPGNSGGPLLNRYGHVVGIVTALANPTQQEVFIGIGFAVPITVAGGAAGLPPY